MKSCLKTEHSPSHDRTIRFSSIRIREYPYELSHNPSVSAGVPISIGWEHESEYSVDIENYDSTLRKKSGSKRPCPNILDVSTRSSILLGVGYTPEDISEAAVSVSCVQKSRMRSVKDAPLTGFYKRFEESVFLEETGPQNRKTSCKRRGSPPNIRIARVA